MSKQNNLTDFLVDVANAIRTKKGTSLPINPQNFSSEIASLSGSGGLEIVDMTETTATIEPNKVYVWGMVESLNITLGASTNDSDFFAFRFRCSKPTMTSLTVNGATWADDTVLDETGKPVLDPGSWYQCEIKLGTAALYARLAHYIPFADSNVEAVLLANGIGDGLGITYKAAAKVKDIQNWFNGNKNITSFDEFINFSGITKLPNNAFNGCTYLVEITLPASLTMIGNYAFQDCAALTKVNGLGSTQVTSLGPYVFQGCTSLVEITLPATLTSIGNYVFRGCESLKYFSINANTPPTLSWAPAFPSTIDAIYVPDESITAYQEATGWTSYASKIKGISEMPA